MTNGDAPSPKALRIEARVIFDSGWVELDPPRGRITKGGTVTWVFTGVPNDFRPALLFEGFTPEADTLVGSADLFQNLFSQLSRQGNEIHGSGFRGLPGEYMYKIYLVAADGDDPRVHKLQCRNAPAGGLVTEPGPRTKLG